MKIKKMMGVNLEIYQFFIIVSTTNNYMTIDLSLFFFLVYVFFTYEMLPRMIN